MKYKRINYKAVFASEPVTVMAQCHNMEPDEEPDVVVWIERPEDWYVMGHYRDKRVAVVTREEYIRARHAPE